MDENLPKHVLYNLKTLEKDDCFFLFTNEDGSLERVGVKKQIVLAFSEPLRKMVEESLLAKAEDNMLHQVKPETFKNVLKCIYGGAETALISFSVKELVDMFDFIEMYLLEDLKPKVVPLISEQLSIDNVFTILSSTVCRQEDTLKWKLTNWVALSIQTMLDNPAFLTATSEVVLWILEQPFLNVSELDLWVKFVEWVKNQFSVDDSKLGTVRANVSAHLKHFRFGSMRKEEFYVMVVPTDLLCPEQVVQVSNFLSVGRPITCDTLCVLESRAKIAGMISFSDTIFIGQDLSKWTYSKGFLLCDFHWKLMVKLEEAYLAFFLVCMEKSNRKWYCKTSFDLTLVNQYGKPNLVRKIDRPHKITSKENDWGFRTFCPWEDIRDFKNGFIKNNGFVVSINMVVEEMEKLYN